MANAKRSLMQWILVSLSPPPPHPPPTHTHTHTHTSRGSETHLQGCVLAGCMPAPAGRPLRPLQHEVSTQQEWPCQLDVHGSPWPT